MPDVQNQSLKDLAIDVFTDEAEALAWLERPHPLLDGMSPNELAANPIGVQRVRNMLVAIKFGGVA